ncbi:MAG: iron ABC transporter permease [Treponema sp.]|jgi:iron complex transport system permease protein|nr:iron ABC transporter permease [Treponema sp.]
MPKPAEQSPQGSVLRHSRFYPPLPVFLVLGLSLIPACTAAVLLGSGSLSLEDTLQGFRFFISGRGDRTAAAVIFGIRLPRLILALAAGAALGVSGAGYQGIFRNSLADPYVIGASSGAALGAGLSLCFGLSLPFVQAGVASASAFWAFAGSMAAVFLAFSISRSAGNPPPVTALLLAGTAVSAFFSAILSFVLVLYDRNLYRVYYWLLGSLAGTSWSRLFPQVPLMLAGCIAVMMLNRPLDLLIQGDETAENLGVNVGRIRLAAALGCSLAASAAVSAAGIIGFIGLVSPHVCRLMLGPVHRRLIPASALTGALLVVLADTLARSLASPLEIPVGIISSLGGAPFFLFMLSRAGGRLGRL